VDNECDIDGYVMHERVERGVSGVGDMCDAGRVSVSL